MSSEPHVSPRWGSDAIDPTGFNIPSLKAKYLLAHVPATGRVLEVGSGSGKFLRTLVTHRPELEVYGCDIAPWDPPEGITFKLMTNEIPYDAGMFDAVLIVDVLEHVPDPQFTIGEIARVLKPGGRLVAFVPIEGEKRSLYHLYRKLLGEDLYVETKHHVNAFTYDEVTRLLKDRFDVVDTSYIYHWLGHAMDATFFAAARLPQLAKFWWRENKYYAGENQKQSPLAYVLNRLLEAGNALAYLESRALQHHKLGVAGLLIEAHLTAAGDLARAARAV